MKRYNVHLDDDQIARLRTLAEAKGTVVAELIRRYVEAGICKDEARQGRAGKDGPG